MCYYNGQKVTREEYIRLKNLEKAIAAYDFLKSDLHIGFTFGPHAVIKPSENTQDFDLVQMEWGFIPSPDRWPFMRTREDVTKVRNGYMDATGRFQQPMNFLNAIGEELLLPNKVYRDAALHRRCLVISTGFFEWRHVHGINKRTGQPKKTAEKYPYYISVKEKEYFFIAGIWQPWTDESTGEYTETVAIVTTKANELMKQIHNSKERMPTILNEDLAWEWMFGNLSEDRITELATTQFPSNQMQACTIAKNFREQLEPTKEFAYEDLPALELNFG
jgi:putative SOS response-associated peptidase YedK